MDELISMKTIGQMEKYIKTHKTSKKEQTHGKKRRNTWLV
jgi:hypothetical protein